MGPFAIASRSISSPPARLIAPATPAPIQRWLLAAFATASTATAAMSPSTTSNPGAIASRNVQRQARLVSDAGEQAELPLREGVGCGGRDAADPAGRQHDRRDGKRIVADRNLVDRARLQHEGLAA